MNENQIFHKRIYKNIEHAIIEAEISKVKLAERLGISKQNVSFVLKKLKDGKSINTKTLSNFAEALEVPLENFFK